MDNDEKPAEDAATDDIWPNEDNTPVRPAGRQGRFDPIPSPTRDQIGKKRIGG